MVSAVQMVLIERAHNATGRTGQGTCRVEEFLGVPRGVTRAPYHADLRGPIYNAQLHRGCRSRKGRLRNTPLT